MEDEQLKVIDEHKEQIGLVKFVTERAQRSENLEATKQAVHEIIFSALRRMVSIADVHKPIYRLLATHAVRKMIFYNEIVERIYQEFHLHLEVIDGIEEGRLASLGMIHGLDLEEEIFLGVDVGGGSTEIVLREDGKCSYSASISTGALNLTEEFLGYQKYKGKTVRQLQTEILRTLVPIVHDLEKRVAGRKIRGVISAGTGKAIGSSYVTLTYPSKNQDDVNGVYLKPDDLEELADRLVNFGSYQEIRSHLTLSEARSKILLAGTEIIRGITRLISIEKWVVSTYGLREGAVIDTFTQAASPKPYKKHRIDRIKSFANRCEVDLQHANRCADLGLAILKLCRSKAPKVFRFHHLERPKEMLLTACLLHECGRFISFPKFHRHSHYLILNGRFAGLDHKSKKQIALIARHHRKSTLKPGKSDTRDMVIDEVHELSLLSGILRLVAALYRTRVESITSVGLDYEDLSLNFKVHFTQEHNPEVCLLQAQMELPNLEKSFRVPVKIDATNLECQKN